MEVHTVGIMFDDPTSGRFPTLDEISQSNYANTYRLDLPESWGDSWVAIAYDPRVLMYGDEDSEAMDETNFAALVDALYVDLSEVPRVRSELVTGPTYQHVTVGVDEATALGVALIDNVLCVDSREGYEDELYVDLANGCKDALRDYPLLDESAYSEREWEAWQEYAPTALGDEIRDASRDETYDEETLERISELSSDLLPVLASHLHYESGFSGEYGPPFLEVFADLLASDDLALLEVWNPLRARTLRENVQETLAGC